MQRGYPDWKQGLVCPKCAVYLNVMERDLSCPKCQNKWPVRNGIPHFVEDFPYWGEIPLDQMRQVNEHARKGHWRAALLDSQDPCVRRASEMILNLDRANWQWLLELPSDARVLDVGAGMGTNSHALGKHYREVVALEPVCERAHFMQQRFSQEGLSNIHIVLGSLWTLPFAPKTFDLIVMNGVLEWVAEARDGDPRKLQESALCKMRNLLRPGGYLYLGIENRFALGYFFGYPDPHCGLPFVTIMPRSLAQWYAKKKGHGGYRNYLYSTRGYRKLFRRAGFAESVTYLALPSYNEPRHFIPLNNREFSYYWNCLNWVSQHFLHRITYKALWYLKLLRYFQYSFAIFARK